MKPHRFAKGTADRSDGPPKRARNTKPIAEGGTRPHLGTCASCSGAVIHHRRVGGVPIMLDPADLQHGDDGARFVIFAGSALQDPDPRNVPEGMPYHREHRCPPSTTEP